MMKMMLMTALLREGKVALFFSFGAKHDAFRSSGNLIFHSEVGSGLLMIEDKPFICLHVDSSNDWEMHNFHLMMVSTNVFCLEETSIAFQNSKGPPTASQNWQYLPECVVRKARKTMILEKCRTKTLSQRQFQPCRTAWRLNFKLSHPWVRIPKDNISSRSFISFIILPVLETIHHHFPVSTPSSIHNNVKTEDLTHLGSIHAWQLAFQGRTSR